MTTTDIPVTSNKTDWYHGICGKWLKTFLRLQTVQGWLCYYAVWNVEIAPLSLVLYKCAWVLSLLRAVIIEYQIRVGYNKKR